jgi:uronate dehydrogenase
MENFGMKRVLITGAAGEIGTRLRVLLKPIYPQLVTSDVRRPADLRAAETFAQVDLADAAAVDELCRGIDGIVHLGGKSIEGTWDEILHSNIIGCYNLFEGARKAGVKRIIFASSNHAVGFHERETTISGDVVPRPDSRYGVSKLFGEGIGALYAYKHGIGVTSLRIGNFADAPIDVRRLSIWLRPDDLVRLIRIGLERPGIVYEVFYGISDNERAWFDNRRAVALGYAPEGRSEPYAEAVIAAEPKDGKSPVAEHYQGGTFCAAEYSADFATIKKSH